METNIAGLIYSMVFLISTLIIAFILSRSKRISPEFVRKFIHIGVSNWWFILNKYKTTLKYAIIEPIVFIIVNSLATFLNWTKVFKMNDRIRNLGLIYFPISLTILVILTYTGVIQNYICGMAVLIMGYSDGLAAVFGMKFGKKKIFGMKSYVGSVAMFFTSLIVMILFSNYYNLGYTNSAKSFAITLLIALAVTVIEIFTPLGLDNITVPLSSAFLLHFSTSSL